MPDKKSIESLYEDLASPTFDLLGKLKEMTREHEKHLDIINKMVGKNRIYNSIKEKQINEESKLSLIEEGIIRRLEKMSQLGKVSGVAQTNSLNKINNIKKQIEDLAKEHKKITTELEKQQKSLFFEKGGSVFINIFRKFFPVIDQAISMIENVYDKVKIFDEALNVYKKNKTMFPEVLETGTERIGKILEKGKKDLINFYEGTVFEKLISGTKRQQKVLNELLNGIGNTFANITRGFLKNPTKKGLNLILNELKGLDEKQLKTFTSKFGKSFNMVIKRLFDDGILSTKDVLEKNRDIFKKFAPKLITPKPSSKSAGGGYSSGNIPPTNILSKFSNLFGGGKSGGLIGTAVVAAIVSYLTMLKEIYNIYKEMVAKSTDFVKQTGFLLDYTYDLQMTAAVVSAQWGHIGVEIKDVYSAMIATSKAIGTMGEDRTMLGAMARFNVQLGISAETSAEFLAIMSQIGRKTMEASTDTLMLVAAAAMGSKTPLGPVMDDISAAAKSSYTYLSRNPAVLIKAAVEARRMGTSLQSATETSKGLLNFTQSVKDEMEASVLLGKSLNLQKARELAYHRDISGLNREILRLAQEQNIENKDIFAQDAFAKALGKSYSEIEKMLLAERERIKSGKTIAQVSKEQLALDMENRVNQDAMKALMINIRSIWFSMLPVLTDISAALRNVVAIITFIVGSPAFKMLSNMLAQLSHLRTLGNLFQLFSTATQKTTGNINIIPNYSKPQEGRREAPFFDKLKESTSNLVPAFEKITTNGASIFDKFKNYIFNVESRSKEAIQIPEKKKEVGFSDQIDTLKSTYSQTSNDNNKKLDSINDNLVALKDVLANKEFSTHVNLDSQLVASSSDRMTRFRRGYGVNDTSKIG
jgi:hypothetical protein